MATTCRQCNIFRNKVLKLFPALTRGICTSRPNLRDVSTSDGKVHTKNQVVIPPKIERGPTDILKALASTVGKDYTAAHYRYHDDPYLIPVSNLAKRSFALSKESGRKAAKWIRQQHADLFNHRVAEPPIEAFYPTPVFSEDSVVDEAVLQNLIRDSHLTDAVKVYEMLKIKGTSVSRETKQSLLELIAYYNEAEPLDEEWTEERWYRAGVVAKERPRNTWKENGLAENIFKELDPADAQAYCALIRGRAKHNQVEKAWHLLREAQAKSLQIDIETYNSIIRIVNLSRENSELRWQLLEELLLEIKNAGLDPNLGTLNAILESVSTFGNIRQSKTLCLAVLSEFKELGITPCLASYYYVLMSHCKERGPVSSILVDILNEIEGKSFTIHDPKDTFFFVTAMDLCRNHLQDLDLANKVNKLLHVGNNYDLIGDSYKESVYYRHFMGLKCSTDPFDTFMEFYNKLVPNIYTPEPQIMEEILKSLQINEGFEYIPQLWSDMIIFDQTYRETLVSLLLSIMSSYTSSSEFRPLTDTFADIAWKVWNIIETQDPERTKKISWTGQMLGNIIIILLKASRIDDAFQILKKLLQSPLDILGVPDIDALKLFLDCSVERNNAVMSLACIQYVSDFGFAEVVEMALSVFEKVSLDGIQVARLSNIVGFDLATEKSVKSSQNLTGP